MAAEIPVVDFSCFSGFDGKEPSNEVVKLSQEINNAFTTIGFVYIKNHGIPANEISELFEVSKRFFNLPFEDKEKFATKFSLANYQGWLAPGREIVDPNEPFDLKEAYDIAEPYSNDISWPSGECSDFKDTVVKFYQSCEKLTHDILELISFGLQLKDRRFFTKAHGKFGTVDNKTILRLLYYPTVEEDLNKPGQIRLGEHTDYGTITLLFQDEAGGLEVFSQKDGYVSAPPIKGTILVNIGDLLQRWSSDKLVSTRHRVIVPRDEKRRFTSRQSVAFFVHPDNDVVIECLDDSKRYPPVRALDYLHMRLNDTFLY